jgi:protein-tyrosine-phosphatase
MPEFSARRHRSMAAFGRIDRAARFRYSRFREFSKYGASAVSQPVYNVLFLCTRNSARSIIAECLLNKLGEGRFRAHSAGSWPARALQPAVRDLLQRSGFDTGTLRSKSWDEYAAPDAPALDFVFTLCDRAAGETCPVWPGQPMTAHWPFPDPATFAGSEAEKRAFVADVFRQIHNRIGIFVNLPIASLDKLSLQARLDDLGRAGDTTPTTV